MQTGQEAMEFPGLLQLSKKRLSPTLLKTVDSLEKIAAASPEKDLKIQIYRQLSRLWMDSAGVFVPFAKYTAEAAKLENSEKSLNFAAQLLLSEALSLQEKPLQAWMAREARTVFEQSLAINSGNDSTKIGLGACYFLGAANEGEPPMKGVFLIREVAERDPGNAYAQWMLGVGAAESGQWEKAVERFRKVYSLEPDNLDALLRLANVYEQSGNKNEAVRWYRVLIEQIRRLEKEHKFQPGPDMIRRLEEHIKSLEN